MNWKKRFVSQKLNVKFTLVIILFMVIPIGILAGILFYNMEKNVVSENTGYMEYTMERNKDAVATKINSINMSTQFFLSDEPLLEMLKRTKDGETFSAEEWYSFKNSDIVSLERLVNNNPLLYGVRVYASNDRVQEMMPILYAASRMEKQPWQSEETVTGWHYDFNDQIFNSYTMRQNRKILSLVTEIKDSDSGTLGMIEAAMTMENMFPSLYENLANQENALDTSVQSLIGQFESESDVVELQSEVQTRYDEALAADENLANMIQTTIPAAIKDWVSQVAAQAATEQTEATEAAEQPETEQPQETEQQEETVQQTETLATKDRVNVRAAADTESEKLGTLDQGTVVTRTAVDGDWSVIDYNGTTGYVKNEFLTYDLPDTTAENNSDSSSDNSDSTNSASIAEGTVIMLENTTNIRSGMSEDSSKVGTAYAGEKVTVVMSYAEGWTKVKWNGETGYIKTALLQ